MAVIVVKPHSENCVHIAHVSSNAELFVEGPEYVKGLIREFWDAVREALEEGPEMSELSWADYISDWKFKNIKDIELTLGMVNAIVNVMGSLYTVENYANLLSLPHGENDKWYFFPEDDLVWIDDKCIVYAKERYDSESMLVFGKLCDCKYYFKGDDADG